MEKDNEPQADRFPSPPFPIGIGPSRPQTWSKTMTDKLTITPLGPHIGAVIAGVNLAEPLSQEQFEQASPHG